MSKSLPRSENGRRIQAEDLHAVYNRDLQCPSCGYKDRYHGVFRKDCAGKADNEGRCYRRFVCRSQNKCGKSIGVTEFLGLCQSSIGGHEKKNLSEIKDDGRRSIELFFNLFLLEHVFFKWSKENTQHAPSSQFTQPRFTFSIPKNLTTKPELLSVESNTEERDSDSSDVTGNQTHAKEDNTANEMQKLQHTLAIEIAMRKELQKVVEALSKRLDHIERRFEKDVEHEIYDNESVISISSTNTTDSDTTKSYDKSYNGTFRDISNTTDARPTPKISSNIELLPELAHGFDDIKHMSYSTSVKTGQPDSVKRSPADLATSRNIPTSPGLSTNSKFQNSKRVSSVSALYVLGMPHIPIREVKRVLSQRPVSIQLRHVYYYSWIDGRVLEMLVDNKHVQKICNRITHHSTYTISSSFNPLEASSFNWNNDMLPESKKQLLKSNLVKRLGASINATSLQSTRQHILSWAYTRGIGLQLLKELKSEGCNLMLPESNIKISANDRAVATNTSNSKPSLPVTFNSGLRMFTSQKRRCNSPDSDCIEK
ncbi:hypothetical protein HOY82DRAFT_543443 [Tuber indicum]|nr:hypothetical protein HOY82DRAFT_543443 [Tuber indicum]